MRTVRVKERSVVISTYLPISVVEKLETHADQQQLTVSQFIKEMVLRELVLMENVTKKGKPNA